MLIQIYSALLIGAIVRRDVEVRVCCARLKLSVFVKVGPGLHQILCMVQLKLLLRKRQMQTLLVIWMEGTLQSISDVFCLRV